MIFHLNPLQPSSGNKMLITNYDEFPRLKTFKRLCLFVPFVWFIFALIGGIVALQSEYQPDSHLLQKIPTQVSPFFMITYLPPVFLKDLVTYSSSCNSSQIVNDLQKEKCAESLLRFLWEAACGLGPLILTFMAFRLSWVHVKKIYKMARKSSEYSKKTGGGFVLGVVTAECELDAGFFGWVHCFRAICVELPDRHQLKIYIPDSMELPAPGVRFALFDLGKVFGERRWVGEPYLPHVAVFRG